MYLRELPSSAFKSVQLGSSFMSCPAAQKLVCGLLLAFLAYLLRYINTRASDVHVPAAEILEAARATGGRSEEGGREMLLLLLLLMMMMIMIMRRRRRRRKVVVAGSGRREGRMMIEFSFDIRTSRRQPEVLPRVPFRPGARGGGGRRYLRSSCRRCTRTSTSRRGETLLGSFRPTAVRSMWSFTRRCSKACDG